MAWHILSGIYLIEMFPRTTLDQQLESRAGGGGMVRVTGRLAISGLQLRDSGDYKCGASNTAGAESAEVVQEVKVVRAEEVSNSRYCLFPNIFVITKLNIFRFTSASSSSSTAGTRSCSPAASRRPGGCSAWRRGDQSDQVILSRDHILPSDWPGRATSPPSCGGTRGARSSPTPASTS